MSIQMSVLGSGSSGNATLLCLEEESSRRHILIDAGFSPRELTKRMAQFGVTPEMLDAILITHLHRDHFKEEWLGKAKRHDTPIYLHQQHTKLWTELGRSALGVRIVDDSFELGSRTQVTTVRLPHDQQGSVGYIVEHNGTRLGFATDLGQVPKAMIEKFHSLDALAIESNYDPTMQRNSSRPAYLKKRVMGNRGHLSNEQAWKAVRQISQQSNLHHIFFLHLSRQCNAIHLVEKTYEQSSPELVHRLIFTDQFVPTPLVSILPLPQPSLAIPQNQLSLF